MSMIKGGCSAVADELSKRIGKNVSRQQIHTWWTRRDHNGFPEGRPIVKITPTGKSLNSREFDVDEVINWYSSYVPDKGGRPPKDLEQVVYDEAV